MPALKTYDLFISQAWNYNGDIYGIEEFLYKATLFKWRNFSVLEHDLLINLESRLGREKLLRMIDIQIRPFNCIKILGGMYATYSDLINKEILISKKYRKHLIGFYPWGQTIMLSIIQNSAAEIVRWKTKSIINAIRKYSR